MMGVLRRLLRKTRVNFICVYSVEPQRLTSQIGAQDKDTFRAAAQAGAIIIFFPPGRIYHTLATYGVIAPADGAPIARTRLIASGMPDTGGATPGVFCHSKPLPLRRPVLSRLQSALRARLARRLQARLGHTWRGCGIHVVEERK